MPAKPFPYKIHPNPNYITIVVIGTRENLKAYKLEQHQQGSARYYAWSRALPALDSPDKVMIVLNRQMPPSKEPRSAVSKQPKGKQPKK